MPVDTCSENSLLSRVGRPQQNSITSSPRVVDELADAEEELRALRERDRPPLRERLPGRLDCAVDLLCRREVDLAGEASGRRVVDGAAAARLAGDGVPPDPVADPLDARALLDGRSCKLCHRPLLCLRPGSVARSPVQSARCAAPASSPLWRLRPS